MLEQLKIGKGRTDQPTNRPTDQPSNYPNQSTSLSVGLIEGEMLRITQFNRMLLITMTLTLMIKLKMKLLLKFFGDYLPRTATDGIWDCYVD